MTIVLIAAATAAAAYLWLRAIFRRAPLLDEAAADFTQHTDEALATVEEDPFFAARWHEIVNAYGQRGSAA